MKLSCGKAQNGERMLIADDNRTHLLAQFHDLRTRLDDLQQQFTLTTDLDEKVQLTLQMQAVIDQALTLIRAPSLPRTDGVPDARLIAKPHSKV